MRKRFRKRWAHRGRKAGYLRGTFRLVAFVRNGRRLIERFVEL